MNGTRLVLMSAIAAAILAAGAHGAGRPGSPSGKPSSPVVIEMRRDGFDWKDAGVGAAAALAVVVIAVGVALVLRDRHVQGGDTHA